MASTNNIFSAIKKTLLNLGFIKKILFIPILLLLLFSFSNAEEIASGDTSNTKKDPIYSVLSGIISQTKAGLIKYELNLDVEWPILGKSQILTGKIACTPIIIENKDFIKFNEGPDNKLLTSDVTKDLFNYLPITQANIKSAIENREIITNKEYEIADKIIRKCKDIEAARTAFIDLDRLKFVLLNYAGVQMRILIDNKQFTIIRDDLKWEITPYLVAEVGSEKYYGFEIKVKGEKINLGDYQVTPDTKIEVKAILELLPDINLVKNENLTILGEGGITLTENEIQKKTEKETENIGGGEKNALDWPLDIGNLTDFEKQVSTSLLRSNKVSMITGLAIDKKGKKAIAGVNVEFNEGDQKDVADN